MTEISNIKSYSRTPSLLRELLVLILWLLLLSFLVYVGATKAFTTGFDLKFFSGRMAPIYGLYGTVCLAYEFITSIRNESNRNRLNQEYIKATENRSAAIATMTNEIDRNKRVKELDHAINILKSDLEHEMQYGKRKFFIAWFGLLLCTFGTLVSVWAA